MPLAFFQIETRRIGIGMVISTTASTAVSAAPAAKFALDEEQILGPNAPDLGQPTPKKQSCPAHCRRGNLALEKRDPLLPGEILQGQIALGLQNGSSIRSQGGAYPGSLPRPGPFAAEDGGRAERCRCAKPTRRQVAFAHAYSGAEAPGQRSPGLCPPITVITGRKRSLAGPGTH